MGVICPKHYPCVNRERPNRTSTYHALQAGMALPVPDKDQSQDAVMMFVPITTEWQDIACGHITSYKDSMCGDCKWKHPEPEMDA